MVQCEGIVSLAMPCYTRAYLHSLQCKYRQVETAKHYGTLYVHLSTIIHMPNITEKERTFSKISVSSNERLDVDTSRESPLPRPISDNVLQKRKSVDFQGE